MPYGGFVNQPLKTAAGQPLGPKAPMAPNPDVLYGQQDMIRDPIQFNRIGTRWGDRQLINPGSPSWSISALRLSSIYQAAGYIQSNPAPVVPGQSRLSGGPNPGGYVPNGPAPSQWAAAQAATAGSQPQYPGGPGQMLAPNGFRSGGSGA